VVILTRWEGRRKKPFFVGCFEFLIRNNQTGALRILKTPVLRRSAMRLPNARFGKFQFFS
jgi:hypothetical protein